MKKFLIALFALLIVVAPVVAHAEDEAPAPTDGTVVDGSTGASSETGTDAGTEETAPAE